MTLPLKHDIFHNLIYTNFSIILLLCKTNTVFSKEENKGISHSFQIPMPQRNEINCSRSCFTPGLGLNAPLVSLRSPNNKSQADENVSVKQKRL